MNQTVRKGTPGFIAGAAIVTLAALIALWTYTAPSDSRDLGSVLGITGALGMVVLAIAVPLGLLPFTNDRPRPRGDRRASSPRPDDIDLELRRLIEEEMSEGR